ncbi:HAMP domain-containing sensor histidine kinase [Massilia sp. erpn]|uniref:sensor histidine kinase n=1 Tax=Massilia sp. erpn TaxID=2738142 RepID=UPI00210708EE|nr:ATP-binding protein [Massilia sp. erpn]UTY59624.1 sensor histidine kinase [Massilia sp. erpn]
MKTRWRRLWQPSLAQRMLLAQLGLLSLLWLALCGYAIYDTVHQNEDLGFDQRYELALAAARNLSGDPVRQRDMLQHIDRINRGDGVQESNPSWQLLMEVWQDGKMVYASPELEQPIRGTQLGVTQQVQTGQRKWLARTVASPDGRFVVTLAQPADLASIYLTHSGLLLMPLLVCLPFMLLPAWISVRLALRPWRRVSAEIAERGPHDLTPLDYLPPHRELHPLVDNINRLLGRVRESARRERNFIADAAHEIRTPLAAMQVNIEAAIQRTPDTHLRALLDGSLLGVQRASHLVHQLLALMRSEAAGAARQQNPLPLHTLLQECCAMLAPLACQRGVELELQADGDVKISGDTEGMLSLFENLINNAIKYSPDGGLVRIAVHSDGVQAVITVSDEGPGVAPELYERLCERFFRVPGQRQGGSGLGLAIAAVTVARHEGRLRFGPANGGGLQVTTTLPLAA